MLGTCVGPWERDARTRLQSALPTMALPNAPVRPLCLITGRQFQACGPFWGRQYLFWHGGRPLTLIHEVFSTALQDLLGPMCREER